MKQNIAVACLNKKFKKEIAKKLALELGMFFADIEEMVKYENTGYDKLLKMNGDNYYYELEKKTFKQLSEYKNCVITLDGYGLFAGDNIEILKKNSYLIFIKNEYELFKNLSKNDETEKEAEKIINEIVFEERNRFFSSKADVIIDVKKPDEKAIIRSIKDKLLELKS